MDVTILGKKKFSSNKDNVVKDYYMFVLTYLSSNVEGCDSQSVFVPNDTYDKYKCGDVIKDVRIDFHNHTLIKNL